MQDLSQKHKTGVIAVVALLLGAVGVVSLRNLGAANVPAPVSFRDAPAPAPAPPPDSALTAPDNAAADPATPQNSSPPAEKSVQEIVVHVTGAVKSPGVYRLKSGDRGEDALKAAGGPGADCDTDALNLAARLEDETRLHFPTKKEREVAARQPDAPEPELVTVGVPKPTPAAAPAKSAARGGSARAASPGKSSDGGKLTAPGQGSVNINAAGPEELQRLPGIGPAMAERVVAYRQENGGFKAPEDLLHVSGIGPKKFAKMAPFVRVR